MKRIVGVLLILLLLVIAGCQDEVSEIEINASYLSGPTALTMLQMAKEQPSLGENITVSYEMTPATDVMTGKITAGELDFAVIATSQAAMLYNLGIEYQIVAPSVWGVLFMIGSEELVNMDDLLGKEIALIGQAQTPDIMLRHLLVSNGIDPDEDVTLTYLSSPEELVQGFNSGRFTLGVVPQPLATVVQVNNQDLSVVLDFQEEWSNLTGNDSYPQSALIVKKDLVDNHPDVVKSFIAKYEESINWANANPEQLGEYAVELEVGLPAPIVQKALPNSNLRFANAIDVKNEIESYLEAIYNIMPDAIGGQLPDESFYYSGK
jgi:NitT/TauT family transport system substrate-binding protein